MSEPKSCSLRKTKPIGPIICCKELSCFNECVKITKIEKNIEKLKNNPI